MNQKIILFAAALNQLQQGTGLTVVSRGGAYGSSRLVIVDIAGNEHDYQEALEAGKGFNYVPTNESES
ncbi:hypothetical protein [Cytobacillus horneckiae]|uniref:hypothetical protein n=1 Tax=Cytobacillus horneckiae TaxID=549687 RepID=UPI003D9AA94A